MSSPLPTPPPSSSGSPSSSSVSALPTNSSSNVSPAPSIPAPSSITSPTSLPSPSSSSSSSSRGSTPTTPSTPPYGSPTVGTTPTSESTPSTSTIYSSTVLTESSTRVYETSSIVSSDGQIYTTQITVTSVLAPGTVLNTTTTQPTSSSGSSSTAAIVGGVIGGIVGLGLLALLAYFLFNKKRRLKDEFDGNFDPHAVAHSKHSPHPSQGGAAAVTNDAGRPGGKPLPQINPAEGANGAGPYPFGSPQNQPLPPSHHPQMSQYGQGGALPPGAAMGLGAGVGMAAANAYSNERPQHQGHNRNPSNLSSVSSGNYPASVGNGPPGGAYFGMYDNNHPGGGSASHVYQGQPGQYGQYLQGQQYPQQGQGQGHLQPSLSPTNTTSSGGGLAYNQVYNYAPPIGRGPSPGPSVGRSDTMSQSQYSSSAGGPGVGVGGAGGRTAKEIEAYGNTQSLAAGVGGMMMGMPTPHVVNPDDGPDGPLEHPGMPQPQFQPQQEGYFGAQPPATSSSSEAQNYYSTSAGPGGSAVTSPAAAATSQSTKAGLITLAPSPSTPVQHQDAGRVEENPEAPSEIPPSYDSLPQDIRR